MQEKGRRIAVIGSVLGGGASQVVDAMIGSDQQATAVFDNDERVRGESVFGVPVVGPSDIATIKSAFERGIFDAAVIAIGGDLRERARIFHALQEAGIPTANVIDPSVQLRSGVQLGSGNVLLGGVYLGPNVRIGDNCYIINYTTIQHESQIGDHSYFSTGVALAGRVIVGDRVRFDTRSGAKANLKIGNDCSIAAGCVLTHDLASHQRIEPPVFAISTVEG